MTTARAFHTATFVPLAGKVMIAGGDSQPGVPLASTELYDPLADTFTSWGTLSVPRDHFVSGLIGYGSVVFAGGNSNSGETATADMYFSSDPYPEHSTGEVGSMSVPRAYAVSAIVGADGAFFVAGGDLSSTADGELFNQSLETFYPAATGYTGGSMSSPHGRGTASVLQDNETVAIAGGLDSTDNITNATDVYDRTLGFELGNPLNHARADHAASLLNNGKVLVTGGTDSTGADLSSAELLQ